MTQRVVKYRAYDMHFEEMCYVSSMFWPSKKKNGFDIVEGHGVSGSPYRDITITEMNPLMQFTGLHDKHGKEIYEGDIREEMVDGLFVGDPQREYYFVMVYIKEWTMFTWLSITSGEYHKYLAEGASALDTEMYWTYPAGQDEPNNVELVGNIYTTPELVDPKMIER